MGTKNICLKPLKWKTESHKWYPITFELGYMISFLTAYFGLDYLGL